jgi:biopolymer transport protein ExbB
MTPRPRIALAILAAALAVVAAPAGAQDRADIDRTQIIGNRELPKVLYIVPWKKPLPGDLTGKPMASILDEALAPLDRDVFRRQVRYEGQLRERAAAPAQPRPPSPDPRPISPFPTPRTRPCQGEHNMSFIQSAVKFFQDSGLAIYPSILIMALGLAIAVERFIFLNRARSENRKLWAQVLPMLQSGKFKEVHGVASGSDAAIGKIVANGIERMQSPARREDIDAAMEEGMMEIVPRLEKRTHYIATFANVITLVGLLGTIIGLIKGFTAVAQVNPAEKAEMLSASISIAMNNTAFALTVAIPFLLIHAYLQARTSEIVDGLEAAKISFLNLVQRLKAESGAAAAAR